MRARNEINAERFMKTQTEIDTELAAIDKEGLLLSDRVLHWVEVADGYLTFAENASKVFNETTDLQLKREIVQTLGSNLTIMDKKTCISLLKPLQEVKKVHSATHAKLGRFEPKKTPVKQGLSGEKALAFSRLRTGMAAVRTSIIESDGCFLPSFVKKEEVFT